MYYQLLSQMFQNDSVWTSVNKDNHLKGWINVKNAGRFISGRSQYWLFFYHEQLPAWKGTIFIFFKNFSGVEFDIAM